MSEPIKQLPVCTVCKRQKPPVGRDVAPAMADSYCEHECPGRQLPPYPGRFWPGEEKETEATPHDVQWEGVYRGTERDWREVGYCVDCGRYVYDGDGELHRVEATDGPR